MVCRPVNEKKLSIRISIHLISFCLLMLITFPVEKTFGADKKTDTSSCPAITKLATDSFLVEKAEIVPEGPATTGR